MGRKDPRVDAYIEKAAEFARPVLKHLRRVVHTACPDVEETMKWSFPHFDYQGSMMASMAAFKNHCSFGFWKARLLAEMHAGLSLPRGGGMGHFGKITSLKDLPPEAALVRYVRSAAKLNEAGITVRRAPGPKKAPLRTPAWLTAALRANRKALATYKAFSPSHRREYLEWLLEAKTEDTRQRRLKRALEWMAAGKSRNWKYARK